MFTLPLSSINKPTFSDNFIQGVIKNMKLTNWTLLLSFTFLTFLSGTAFANESEKELRAKTVFEKKFKVSRNAEGKITSVTYRLGGKKFSADSILKSIIGEIKSINRQSKMEKSFQVSSGSGMSLYTTTDTMTQHEAQVAQVVAELYEDYEVQLARKEGAEYAHPERDARIDQLKLSMESVQNDNVVHEFERVEKSQQWKQFSSKLSSVLLRVRPEVLAVPHDQKFFFQRELITEIAKVILQQAAKHITSVPFLGLLGEIFTQMEQIIADQRMFNQNYLLYLLENFKSDNFSLTDSESAQIISSIYQSRLGLVELMQMKKMAEGDWTSYGWNNFYTQKRTANGILAKFEKSAYDSRSTKRISSSFAIVMEKEKKKIVNLFDKAHMFSSKPSLAYDFEKPNKVMITRLLIKLGQMGLGFIPMPGILKSFATSFAESSYRQQILTEGALSAYFTVEGHPALSTHFSRQTLNPFLRQ